MQKQIELLPKDVDGGLITSEANRRYFTGFPSTAGTLVLLKDSAYFLVDSRYYERALHSIDECEVILLKDFQKQLSDLFSAHHCKKIVVESGQMTLREFKLLQKQFPEVTFVDDFSFEQKINHLRSIKTEEEVEKIKAAQKIAERSFFLLLDYIREGVTEQQVASQLKMSLLREGADDIAFDPIVVSGRNSANPHGVPTSKMLEDGDFVTLDFGAKKDGYCSDMTRTIFIGEPSREQSMFYKTVLVGQNLAIDYIKAGQMGYEPDNIARQYFESQGYTEEFCHSLGHGVGLHLHEEPYLGKRSKTTLEKGMVVTVEPGLYLPGKYGVRIEDMVVITEHGCDNLTHCPKDLICL